MSEPNLMEALETAFHNLTAILVCQEYYNVSPDPNEYKSSVEKCTNTFLEAARQLELFFLKKSISLNLNNAREDVEVLRNELQRKDMLLQRLREKSQVWVQSVIRSTGSSHSSAQNQSSAPANDASQSAS